MTAADTISGGAGTDTLEISNDVAAADGIAGLSGIEIVAFSDIQLEVDLGANAAAAGITTLISTISTSRHVDCCAGFTNNLTVNLDADTDANSIVATITPVHSQLLPTTSISMPLLLVS